MKKTYTVASLKKGVALRQSIEDFIDSKKRIISFFTGNKRPIYLDKYIEAQEGRRDKNMRFSCFFDGIMIIRGYCLKNIKEGQKGEWELIGEMSDKRIVAVHIREDKIGNNKTLFLISTFEKT